MSRWTYACNRLGALAPVLLWAVLLLAACRPWGEPESNTAGRPRVQRVIDGDTIVLDTGETVRLIGVNTPEAGQPFYEDAKRFTESLTLGRPVRLEGDVVPVDRYNRVLAYVYLEDGTFVNLEILRQGYGQLYMIPPNVAYVDEFRAAEREARENRRGLWRISQATLRIVALMADAPGSDRANLNGEWVEIQNVGNRPVRLRGFTLSDASNKGFTFPDMVLAPGERLRVYTGSGTPSPGALYWGSPSPIWNNDGDTAYLRAPDGSLVDMYAYGE
ncbi:MAG: lamin tail domain-containing protein [Ardenticatenia bacterium]|nr:lamin tail domain-containing protein [Ardenticatenia bacterium]